MTVALGFACCAIVSCGGGASSSRDETLGIELRWIQGFPRERRSDVETGMLWVLSYLGASLPSNGQGPLSWHGDVMRLSLDRAGIDSSSLASWRRLLVVLKASEEYERMGAIDIGRFVALTLCSARHYYVLTGASADYATARSSRMFDSRMAAIVESGVASGERLIEVALGSTLDDIAFIAHEGAGSVSNGTLGIAEHELLDVMPNGQLRFAVYGADGVLEAGASGGLTSAGKPSKCLWCHETELSRPFRARTSVPGYHSPERFSELVAEHNERLHRARSTMASRIDFTRTQDHTFAELLYLSFYEPSAQRLAAEWGLGVEQVKRMLAGLPTHAHREFDYLGDALYEREQVDPLAPYAVVAVPTDPREGSAYEPDLLP